MPLASNDVGGFFFCGLIFGVLRAAVGGGRFPAIPVAQARVRTNSERMTKKLPAPTIPLPLLQTGQVWRTDDSSLKIGVVEKVLVHYRHQKDKANRGSSSFTSKRELEKFLTEHKAILVVE